MLIVQSIPRYDVIIVGAGPAGSLMGYELVKQGLKVLLIEKESLPRYKACGGGLTRRALKALPFDIDPVVEDYAYTAEMLYRNRPLYVKTHAEPIVAMVMRDAFDHYLIDQAMAQGLVVHENTRFQSVSGSVGDLLIETSKGRYTSKVIAGADGVYSAVGRALGLSVRHGVMTAIEGEVVPTRREMTNRYKGRVVIDFGVIPGGYGWVFPKRDHLSVGVGTNVRGVKGWREYFESYLKLKGIDPASYAHQVRGRLIPINPNRRNRLANASGLVAGDAAGFTDPLTGEGLFYAIRQAALAAEAIRDYCTSGTYIGRYTDSIRAEFGTDLKWARRMAHVLYRYPSISRRLLFRCGEALAQNQTAVILSQQTYRDVFRKIARLMLSPARLLFLFSKG